MIETSNRLNLVLITIIVAQFCGTSLWFAGNAILPELMAEFNLGEGAISNLTSSIQLGFIAGTLTFASLNIADRFSPSNVFLVSSCLGSLANVLIILAAMGPISLWIFRFSTGFFLAGIYPVGMKIASDWYPGKLGKALGYLVGALVLGTAFPHLLRNYSSTLHWQQIMWIISGVSLTGGLLIFFIVPDGPHRVRTNTIKLSAIVDIFKVKDFRLASFGYFGHMWELYTFWAFVPVILSAYSRTHDVDISISLWSFIIIASGFLGCVIGGYVALYKGSAVVAMVQLIISGTCCLTVFFASSLPPSFFFSFLILWGITVVGDSPQFSTLVARTAPKQYIGTALTLTNCIGFGITIFSIQLIGYFTSHFTVLSSLIILTIGPIFGLFSMKSLLKKN